MALINDALNECMKDKVLLSIKCTNDNVSKVKLYIVLDASFHKFKLNSEASLILLKNRQNITFVVFGEKIL